MICYLLYNRDTPAERQMADFAARLEPEDVETELIDADSPRGIQLVETYDLMDRPAVLLIKADGAPLQTWQGEQLPTPTDIGYLAHQ